MTREKEKKYPSAAAEAWAVGPPAVGISRRQLSPSGRTCPSSRLRTRAQEAESAPVSSGGASVPASAHCAQHKRRLVLDLEVDMDSVTAVSQALVAMQYKSNLTIVGSNNRSCTDLFVPYGRRREAKVRIGVYEIGTEVGVWSNTTGRLVLHRPVPKPRACTPLPLSLRSHPQQNRPEQKGRGIYYILYTTQYTAE